MQAGLASPQPATDAHCPQSAQSSPLDVCSRSPSPDLARQPERVLIVKGHPARLATQSEQFANELSQHLGICAPTCRILRKLVRVQPYILNPMPLRLGSMATRYQRLPMM